MRMHLRNSPVRDIKPTSGRRFGRLDGFTLMEMLVTLMLVSLATMLMFQMLGSYRIARERVQSQAGALDRRVLFAEWFRDSVHGLFIDKGLDFAGDERRFQGTTLNPLFAPEGAPSLVEWRLEQGSQGLEMVYTENARERLRLPMGNEGSAHFAYLDVAGKLSPTWPPKLGRQEVSLPAVVLMVREGQGQPLAVAVLGPLKPIVRVYGEEGI